MGETSPTSRNSPGQRLRDQIRRRNQAAEDFEAQALAIYRGLEQDKFWVDADGKYWQIENMEIRHLSNCIHYLRERAVLLETLYSYGETISFWGSPLAPRGEFASIDAEQFMDQRQEERWANPQAWLESTPLMKRLVSVYESWESDGQFADVEGL